MTNPRYPVARLLALAALLAAPLGAEPVTTQTVKLGTESLILEKGTLTVPENRKVPGSRALPLPYQRLKARPDAPPRAPLFLLNGGPGSSNLSYGMVPPDLWGTRDLVMVGYRGVDGPTLPDEAFTKALWYPNADLSREGLAETARVYVAFRADCRSRGIDLDGYTMEAVVADLEDLRVTLGYQTIDLYGGSYGTRLAFLYGLDHASVGRVVLSAAGAPGSFALQARDYDDVIQAYSSIYGRDWAGPLRRVTESMPDHWLWWPIDRGLLKLGLPALLMNPGTADAIFDAYDRADRGDASALAALSFVAPSMIKDFRASDYILKGMPDFEPGRDYLAETDDPGRFGRAFLRGLFGMIQQVPDAERPGAGSSFPARPMGAPTLVLNGTLDTQTPLRRVKAELMPLLPHGSLVVLENYGHFNAEADQPAAYARVLAAFLDEGTVLADEIPPGRVPGRFSVNLSAVAWAATGATVAGVAAVGGAVWWLFFR